MDQFATNSEPDLGILKLSVWDFDDNFDDYELYGGRYLSWLRWRCCVIRGLIFEEDGWFWYNSQNEKEFKEQKEKAIVWYGVGDD